MAHWLLKTEPSAYSFADLQRDGRTVWEGVKNPTALQNLRAMKKGELALIYHSGKDRAIVGLARITSNPYADAKLSNPKLVVVDLEPVKALKPIGLETIKADRNFAGWILLRIGRLSVVPVPPPMWKRLEKLGI